MSSPVARLRFNPSNLTVTFVVVVSLAGVAEAVILTTGLPFVSAILLAPPAAFLLLRYWPYTACSGVVLAAAGPLLAYLLLALLYGVSSDDDWALVGGYLFSCVLILVIATHVVRSDDESVRRLVRTARNVLLLAAAGVALSPLYYPHLPYLPGGVHGMARYAGLFVNPNEAAPMAVVLLNFVLYRPYRWPILNGLAIIVATVAVAVTFSRIGIILFLASLVLFLLRGRRSFLGVFMIPVVTLLSIASLPPLLDAFRQSDLVTLQPQQVRRIEHLQAFFAGRWDRTASTGTVLGYRDFLWTRAAKVIGDNFPHGAGLGSFHHLEGGVVHTSVFGGRVQWMGVHNMYLMMAGEAGVVALALLVVCYGGLLTASFFRTRDGLPFSVVVVILAFWMTSHSALSLQYMMVTLAIAVGVLGRTRTKRVRAHDHVVSGAPGTVERLSPAG